MFPQIYMYSITQGPIKRTLHTSATTTTPGHFSGAPNCLLGDPKTPSFFRIHEGLPWKFHIF